MTTMDATIAGLIRDHMRGRWVREGPGPGCFDRDGPAMARLLAVVDRTATEAGKQEVRAHLLHCPRCRLIYATMMACK
jgi:hypothetical protein